MNNNIVKYIVTALCLVGITYGGYAYFYMPMAQDNLNSKAQLEQLKSLPTDTSDIEKRFQKVNEEHKNLDIELNKLLDEQANKFIPNKEAFLTIITDGIELNNLKIRYFYDLAHETNNSTHRFTFEFSGKLDDVNNFCTYLGKTGIDLSVGEFSLRQLDTKQYLKREFDNIDKLEWYSEKEDEEQSVDQNSPPQDVSDTPPVEEELKDEEQDTTPTVTQPPISVTPPVTEIPKQDESLYDSPNGTIEERLDQLFDFSSVEEEIEQTVDEYTVYEPTQYVEVPSEIVEDIQEVEEDEETVKEEETDSEIDYILSIILEY